MFPTTGLLDRFDRPDQVSADDWARMRPTVNPNIGVLSRQAYDPSAGVAQALAYYAGASYGADAEAFYTVADYQGEGTIRAGVRVTNEGTTNNSGYYNTVLSTGIWRLIRVDTNAETNLTSGSLRVLATGDGMGVQMIGTELSGWWRPQNGNWIRMVTYDVASDTIQYLAGGRLAVGFNTSKIDDFGGGNYQGGGPAGPNPGRSLGHRYA